MRCAWQRDLETFARGRGRREQAGAWQVGFSSRDFVQLPENHNPDAGAEHMLPDRNDVLAKRGSRQASVREKNLILSPAPPYLVLLLGSDKSRHCLCVRNRLGVGMCCIFSLCCTQKVPPGSDSSLPLQTLI